MSRHTKLYSGLLLLVTSLLLGLTICQITDVSSKSYSLGLIQDENKSIKKEIAMLRVSLSQSTALDNFEEKILEEGFEQTTKFEYIMVSSNGDIASR
ncbi:MAG: hypothetical protein PHH88_00550 [Candidatus Pacebacteria bacterium]|nr:hypothetical protein [Candidatus Paceibacterota bacterium]